MLTELARKSLRFATVGRLLRFQATSPLTRRRPFVLFGDEVYSYADVYREAERYTRLYDAERRAREPLSIGIYQDNSPSFLFACFGAALSGDLVFGLNTGFRGDTLAAVIDRGEIGLVLTTPDHVEQIERILEGRPTLGRGSVIVDGAAPPDGMRSLGDALRDAETARRRSLARVVGAQPMVVIYTSGTTGVPKGIPCSHIKLVGAGGLGIVRTGLLPSDRGYVCMPLFHSNAWLLGVMPLLAVGGSMVVTRRFSASAFEDDVLRYGVSYMNYVGQPIHYILDALERRHGGPEGVERALARHPKNRFRIAHGNGASAVDRDKLVRYLGMEHVYELYGSTEAVINTVVKPGDPTDSVGRIRSRNVVILDENGRECPAARVDAHGRILNYEEAVGEICAKVDADNLLFDGYWRDEGASRKKYRDGHYHSGDLGHVRVVKGKRYLYFDGRTDDWIRKDGENFSAETVALYAAAHAEVQLAAAYGVPSEVSDEKVMVAIELRAGDSFDPQRAFDRYMEQQRAEGMDPKWMPDYVRIVTRMPMSATEKILVRELKKQGFDLERHPDMVVWMRERGDTTYRRMTRPDFEMLRNRFAEAGRERLITLGS